MSEKRYILGKVSENYTHEGKLNCEVAITWELEDGKFSMCAEVWLPSKRDVSMCGQCVEKVAAMFPDNAKAQRMAAIWERWHLNDMVAGSPAQMEWLRANPIPEEEYKYPKSYYEVACQKLSDAGLNPDADGYKYGHAWKREELPPEVVAEIESWG